MSRDEAKARAAQWRRLTRKLLRKATAHAVLMSPGERASVCRHAAYAMRLAASGYRHKAIGAAWAADPWLSVADFLEVAGSTAPAVFGHGQARPKTREWQRVEWCAANISSATHYPPLRDAWSLLLPLLAGDAADLLIVRASPGAQGTLL